MYEEDEPIEELKRVFDQAPQGVTGPPNSPPNNNKRKVIEDLLKNTTYVAYIEEKPIGAQKSAEIIPLDEIRRMKPIGYYVNGILKLFGNVHQDTAGYIYWDDDQINGQDKDRPTNIGD